MYTGRVKTIHEGAAAVVGVAMFKYVHLCMITTAVPGLHVAECRTSTDSSRSNLKKGRLRFTRKKKVRNSGTVVLKLVSNAPFSQIRLESQPVSEHSWYSAPYELDRCPVQQYRPNTQYS